MKRSHLAAACTIGLLAATLSGCAAWGAHSPGVPKEERVIGDPATGGDGIEAVWYHRGAEIAITFWGSSTCPTSGGYIHVVEPAGEGNTVSIDLNPVADGPCSRDSVPHTTFFYTPGAITTSEPLRILVADQELVLPVK